jgi:secreted PhoX family phosphatase
VGALAASGPARGNALLKTLYSPAGTDTRGTINNCGTGITPWGTYLSGEENWNGYFFRGNDAAERTAAGIGKSNTSLTRYGRAPNSASRHGWETAGAADGYARWNISAGVGLAADGSADYRNELNAFGWVVEVDPYDKAQPVRKRTALGRFAHESAVFGIPKPGKPLAVYMGDDSRGEYIYKYVSAEKWRASDADPANRITTGDRFLDSGKLYVARFNADGSGNWIELTIANLDIANYAGYDFADQADVLVNARLAADAVGATRMDRPEWCAVHPVTGEVYYTLTNNSNRKLEPAGASQMAVDAANPRTYADSVGGGAPGAPGNINGHILRLRESGDENGATGFTWDVYLFGSESGADLARVNLSSLTADQDFSSPDGLWFSRKSGLCFIQTDDGAYTDVTNCMMLLGIPGQVGDGGERVLSYTKADGSTVQVTTRIGATPTPDTLRRFLVGPKDCEITGICETPDGQAIFVNIQHPGETITKAAVATPAEVPESLAGKRGLRRGWRPARLHLAQRKAGVDVFHVRQVDQHLARELREAVQVARDHLQLEGAGAADVVAGHDLRDLADRLLHLARALAGVAVGVQPHEGQHAQADLVAVDLGVVALDVAGLLQRPHAPPARRRRQARRAAPVRRW